METGSDNKQGNFILVVSRKELMFAFFMNDNGDKHIEKNMTTRDQNKYPSIAASLSQHRHVEMYDV